MEPDCFDHIQSQEDTPCRVRGEAYGKSRTPLLSLSKWDREAGILFKSDQRGERVHQITHTGEGLVMTTNTRRHRYRRLNRDNFEFDIILPEEPESPVLTLPLEFPAGLTFHKQMAAHPERMPPLLRGSYAVYWKRGNNQYRTGKLCHIYRPLVIDGKGRKIWGELDFDGESFFITVPETFLKNAVYPVTVDPIVGTKTRGAHWENYDEDPGTPFNYEIEMPLYSYEVPQTLGLNMKASMYIYDHGESEAVGIPALYHEDSEQTGILRRVTSVGDPLSLELGRGETEGWKSVDFTMDETVGKGETVWFGWYPEYFLYSYYDYFTVKLADSMDYSAPPDIFPTDSYSGDKLLSQYFSYDPAPLNFARSIEDRGAAGDTANRVKGINRGIGESAVFEDRSLRTVTWVKRFAATPLINTTLQGARKFFAVLDDNVGAWERCTSTLMKIIGIVTQAGIWDYSTRLMTPGIEVRTLYSPITVEMELTERFSMKRIFVNQSRLVLKVKTGISLEDAGGCEIRYVKPDGSTGSFTALVGDSALGIITYKVNAGDLDMSGWWKFRSVITFPGGDEAPGRWVRVFVYE